MKKMKGHFRRPHVERPQATEREIEWAFELLRNNLQKRIKQHGLEKHSSPAESMGILLEEWKELIDAHQSNDTNEFAQEMLDVGVTCIWAIVSLIIDLEKDDGYCHCTGHETPHTGICAICHKTKNPNSPR
jgi:NTP pyrophosphatase (non-canonical NTP hydrolase)